MDIYKIGVTIALTNEMSKIIAIISTDLLGLTKRIGEVESAWKKLGSMNVMTTLGLGAGVIAMGEMVKGVEDLSHELVQLQKTGMSPELFKNIREQAKQSRCMFLASLRKTSFGRQPAPIRSSAKKWGKATS